MPNSVSSVRGLGRAFSLDDPAESPEQMMARIDRAEIEAVCRHLVGAIDTRPLDPAGRR